MRPGIAYSSTPDAVIRALHDARGAIATPEQWCRGRLTDGGQRLCLEGALRSATDGDRATLSDCFRVLRLILGLPYGPIRSLFDWNDHLSRRHSEVLLALDTAAEHAEQIMTPDEVPA